MSRILYLNNQWINEAEANLSIFDRATLFADAVYEVTCVLDGKMLDFAEHMARLRRSLSAMKIDFHIDFEKMLRRHRIIMEKNALGDGLIYLQVSRGITDRDFLYNNTIAPSFFMFTQKPPIDADPISRKALKMLSWPEGRWAYRHIKTTQLTYSSLAKTAAHDQGKDDVVFIENGHITEASSSNFHMVDANGTVITHPLDNAILPGITRARMIKLAGENAIRIEERAFTLNEALNAKELFISSASNFMTPVVELDGKIIGDGKAGEVTKRLRQLYLTHVPRL